MSPVQGQTENVIKAKIELVEPLGARTYVYLTSIDGIKLVADVSRCFDLHSGDTARVRLDVEQLYAFEPGDMGRNVSITQ